MSQYFLHRDVFCCLVDGSVVFLDGRRAEYLAVEATQMAELSVRIAEWAIALPGASQSPQCSATEMPKLLTDLARRGILTTSARDGKAARATTVVSGQSLPATSYRTDAARVRSRDVVSFLRAMVTVTLRLRRRELLKVLRRIEAGKASHHRVSSPATAGDAGSLTRAFNRLRVWGYTADGACLKDSLVLAEFLLRRGVLPTVVVGVRTKPFGAHAWVQSGDVVLNDSLENVQRYTPILAI